MTFGFPSQGPLLWRFSCFKSEQVVNIRSCSRWIKIRHCAHGRYFSFISVIIIVSKEKFRMFSCSCKSQHIYRNCLNTFLSSTLPTIIYYHIMGIINITLRRGMIMLNSSYFTPCHITYSHDARSYFKYLCSVENGAQIACPGKGRRGYHPLT